ncbi:hypothetical protein [Ornithinibacter aureus]|uniref:hypothetical protein n=1 Tax=Ornithinibacter aureus TaxID=622664 RepID=UPI00135907A0|nr:hypothetical protein [Ornithinibacter aureus]
MFEDPGIAVVVLPVDTEWPLDGTRPSPTAFASSGGTTASSAWTTTTSSPAYGIHLTVFDRQFTCLHAQPEFNAPYQAFRRDVVADRPTAPRSGPEHVSLDGRGFHDGSQDLTSSA